MFLFVLLSLRLHFNFAVCVKLINNFERCFRSVVLRNQGNDRAIKEATFYSSRLLTDLECTLAVGKGQKWIFLTKASCIGDLLLRTAVLWTHILGGDQTLTLYSPELETGISMHADTVLLVLRALPLSSYVWRLHEADLQDRKLVHTFQTYVRVVSIWTFFC